jgi:uncharacterized protein
MDIPRSTDLDRPTVPRWLFWLVLATTVGLFTVASFQHLLGDRPLAGEAYSDASLYGLVAFEAILVAIWVPVLRRLGWSLRGITRGWEWKDLARGVMLAVVAWVVPWVIIRLGTLIAPSFVEPVSAAKITGDVSWFAVVSMSLLNAVFEEFLYLGFAATVLRRDGLAVALVGSAALRFLVHVYQGPMAILAILPIAFLFSAYYLRSDRLWPLVIAHTLIDVLALQSIVG